MTKKLNFEKYAICALDTAFTGFSNLQKGESPDYYNDEIGLEITRAITTCEGEVDNFFKCYDGKEFEVLPKEWLTKMGFTDKPIPTDSGFYKQYSKKYGALFYYLHEDTNSLHLVMRTGLMKSNVDTADDIGNSIIKKLGKLNKNYKLKTENDLALIVQEPMNFDFAKECIIDNVFTAIINKIRSIYERKEYKYLFDTVFIIFLDNIFAIRTKDWTLERKEIPQKDIKKNTLSAIEG